MKKYMISSLEQLNREARSGTLGGDIYIYGAKAIAMRAFLYLEKFLGVSVIGFIVSSKYSNPVKLYSKTVYRIEDLRDKKIDSVIVCVGWNLVDEIIDGLSRSDVKKCFILSLMVYDSWPMSIIKTENVKISKEAFMAESAQIFADETSEIIIESGCLICDHVRIFAVYGGKIIIKSNTIIKENVTITAESGNIGIGMKCFISEKSCVSSKESAEICIGEGTFVGENSCVDIKKSILGFQGKNHVGNRTRIQANDGRINVGVASQIGNDTNVNVFEHSSFTQGDLSGIGNRVAISIRRKGLLKLGNKTKLGSDGCMPIISGKVIIGDKTTVNPFYFIGTTRSKVEIGEENMFSFFVKMDAGGHEISKKDTGEIIDNKKPIRTGKHVWIGMGSTLLPGADIGEGSVVGASSLVNKILPCNCVCVGSPARVQRENIEWRR